MFGILTMERKAIQTTVKSSPDESLHITAHSGTYRSVICLDAFFLFGIAA